MRLLYTTMAFPYRSVRRFLLFALILVSSLGTRILFHSPKVQDKEREDQEFWKEPDGSGYKPCLYFTQEYIQASLQVIKEKSRFLIVVVNGGLNQQRNQIIDAVVIARVLEVALVLPIFKVNQIWQDSSEFGDLFDVEHFKEVLKDDLRVVSSLPSTHLTIKPTFGRKIPTGASPQWFRIHYQNVLQKRRVVLVFRAIDKALSTGLPSDLQKLRCKVAFHALKFVSPIQSIGDILAHRMHDRGPYLALHLRLEKDVWVRTRCVTGLGIKYEEELEVERERRPELLSGRLAMDPKERRNAGLCPLNAREIVRLLKGLGATHDTNIYWAGGEPFGGSMALDPLIKEYPHFYNKYNISLPYELERFKDKPSSMAAIDYIICLNSDVFMPSHGGNMARALKDHRIYNGHWRFITPNKKGLLKILRNSTLSQIELDHAIRDMHIQALDLPNLARSQNLQDVISHPISECICYNTSQKQDEYE